MEFQDALELSKDEFKKMEELQKFLLNINNENIVEVQQFIKAICNLNDHSSVQKLCRILGIIAGIRPNKQYFLFQVYNDLKPQINSILHPNEFFFYKFFKIMKNFEQQTQEKQSKSEQNEAFMYNLKLNSYIETDDLESFQSFVSQTNTKLNTQILQNRFYSSKTLEQLELIEYAVLCGSLNIFKFLLNQLKNFPLKLKNFAVAGGNYEIIHIIEQSKSNFKDENFKAFSFDQETLEAAIEFHMNDIVDYLIEMYELNFDSKSLNSAILSNNFILMNKYIRNEDIYKELNINYANGLINISPTSSIYENIPFIEFSLKVAKFDDQIGIQKAKVFLFISYFNYDSVAQVMIKYRPELVLNQTCIYPAVIVSINNQLFDSIIIFLKYINEKGENQQQMQDIFDSISNNDNKITEMFLDFENISINNEHCPLFSAIQNENLPYLKKVMKNDRIDMNTVNPINGMTPLMYAYEKGNVELFKNILFDERVDVNAKDKREGATVLHHACFDGRLDYVKLLLESKKDTINVNIKNDLNQTALHMAAIENNIEIVEYLVKSSKADTEIKDSSGIFIFLFFNFGLHLLIYHQMIC